MKTATTKLRPPIKRHGGKAYLARRIVSHFPAHRTYVEPFAGGLSVLLNKPRSTVEVASDLDARLINFWRHLCNSPMLLGMLAETDYSESSFQDATRLVGAENDGCTAAWAYVVNNRMSRGGLGKTFAWSDRLRGGQPGDVNAWDTIRQELPAIIDRMRNVRLSCLPAVEVVLLYDSPDTLVYADPPYMPETRTARSTYDYEMAVDAHRELLRVLCGACSAVCLSGYRSPLYDAALADWQRVEWDMPNHSGQGATKQRRTECLWIKKRG